MANANPNAEPEEERAEQEEEEHPTFEELKRRGAELREQVRRHLGDGW